MRATRDGPGSAEGPRGDGIVGRAGHYNPPPLKIERYLLRELAVDLCFAVGGMLVIALPAVAVSAVHRLAGVDTLSILLFLPIVLAGLIPYVLPLGFLLAVVVAYGRLAADQEWTAIRMAGIHPLVIARPALLLAIVLAGLTLWIVSEQLPELRRRERTYVGEALRETIKRLSPGQTELALGRFYLASAWRDGDDFVDARVDVPQEEGESRSFLARRVSFEFREGDVLVHLYGARIVDQVDALVEHTIVRIPIEQVAEDTSASFRSLRYRRSSDLTVDLAGGGIDPARRHEVVYEIHQRMALSAAHVLFVLLGMPVGLLLRRGTQLGALSVAVGFALVYYLLSMRLGKQLSATELVPPVAGAWAVSAAGATIGAVLCWRAFRQ